MTETAKKAKKDFIMSELNRVYVRNYADAEISVDGEWFNRLIESGSFDYDKEKDQDLCEDQEVFFKAMADISGAKVRTEDKYIQLVMNELKMLQQDIADKNLSNVQVTVVEEVYIDDGCQYDVIIDGETYSNYINAAEAETIICAYAKGFEKGRAEA